MYHSCSRLSRRSALALGLGAALPGRRAHAALPAITDALGRSVALKAPAERIVIDCNYEEFTAVAGPFGWNRVVGFNRTQWADNRAAISRRYLVPIPRLAALADVGSTDIDTFSTERLLSLRPDLVILGYWSFVALPEQVKQMEALGILVLVVDYNAEIPERHVASTLALGAATGNKERARTPEGLCGAGPEWRRRGGQHLLARRGAGCWSSPAPTTSQRAACPAPAPGGRSTLNTCWRPTRTRCPSPAPPGRAGNAVLTGFDADLPTTRARLASYARRQGWAGLNAVRSGQVFAVEHRLCRALFDYTATQFIAKAIFPDRFADIDPVAELRRYHGQFLPVAFDGTWMARLTPAQA